MPDPEVKILLVDDQPANLLALRAILDNLHHNLVEAHSGEAALRRLAADDFAVILLNVRMDGLDGFEIARRVRSQERSRQTAIIFLTAHEIDPPMLEQAYALGAVDFLVKPLVPSILCAKVAGFVELCTSRMRAEAAERALREEVRVILNSIGDAVISTDTTGRVTLLNPVAEALTGWTQQEAAGRPLHAIFNIIHEQTRKPVENPIAKVMCEEGVVGLGNHAVPVASEGTERPLDDSAEPIKLDPAAEGLLGWTKAELLGRKMHDITHYQHPDGTPFSIEECAGFQVLHQGRLLRDHDDVFIRKDGSCFPVRYSASPLRSEGQTVGVVVVFRDVTDRKQAEAAVQISEVRYRRLFESAKDGVLILDADTARITDANPFIAMLLGYSHAELLGKELWEIGLFEDKRASQAAVRELQEQHYLRYEDLSLQTKAGRRIDVEFVSNLYREDDQAVIQCNIRDITERKQMQESERWLVSLVESSADAVISKSLDGIIQSWNAAAGRLFGYTPEQAVGRHISILFPADRVDEEDRIIARLRAGERIEHFDTVRVRSDGQPVQVSLTISPIKDAAGQVIGASKIARDITERRRLEDELRQYAAKLSEADRRKDEFLATLAHELRNPLAPIRNSVEVQRLAGPVEPELQWARDVIDRQVQQLARLVDDLLDVSRISRGKITLQLKPVDLTGMVPRAVEISRPLIDARKHRLEVLLPEPAVWVEGDQTRLVQVVSNLLNNAAKYTEMGGRIWLTVEPSASEAVIRVRDTGIGIASEILPRIFEMFTQAQGSMSSSEGGLGVGLSLVRSLVQMHGGSVQALSEGLGRGSEFVIRLPRLQQPASTAAAETRPHPRRKVPARRILVVDDNLDAAETLAMMLRIAGHEVDAAHDGPTALEVARKQPPDVVLCDIGLPHMDGHEVARRLRRDLGLTNALLVALTGYGQAEDKRRSQEAGFNAHLVKPVDLDALNDLLARAPS